MCLHNIEIPPQPNPHFIAKPSANSLDINHPPPRLGGIFDETFWREDIVVPFVTTYAIPLRSAYMDLYIINHYCISSTKLQRLPNPLTTICPDILMRNAQNPGSVVYRKTFLKNSQFQTIPQSFARDFR